MTTDEEDVAETPRGRRDGGPSPPFLVDHFSAPFPHLPGLGRVRAKENLVERVRSHRHCMYVHDAIASGGGLF